MQGRTPIVILVMGLPATGKTVLSEKIAAHLAIPLIAKDAIKERLFDVLGWQDRAWSMQLGHATYRIMDYIAEQQLRAGVSFVLEGTFHPQYDNARWDQWRQQYRFHCVQILCHADGTVLVERFRERDASGQRHPGQDKAADIPGLEESLSRGIAPMLNIPSDTLSVDTTDFARLDDAAILEAIDALVSERCEQHVLDSSRHLFFP